MTVKSKCTAIGLCLVVLAVGRWVGTQSYQNLQAPAGTAAVEKGVDNTEQSTEATFVLPTGESAGLDICAHDLKTCALANEIAAIRRIKDLEIKAADDQTIEQLYQAAQVSSPVAMTAITKVAKEGRANQLERFFDARELAATAKAHLIDAALTTNESQLATRAETLFASMVQSGSVADVLAVLSKTNRFSQESIEQFVTLQGSLCRFQNDSDDDGGFELIKTKFSRVMNNVSPQSWQSVCRN